MLELNAPLPILAPAKEKMIATREALGSDWSVVEAAYHEYAEGRKEDDGLNRAWEKRCIGCVHWKGPPWEWQDDSLDIQEVKWCEQYKLDEIHRPDECPDFSEKITKPA